MSETDSRPACKYGVNCYQRNELHVNRFSHPPKIAVTEQQASDASDASGTSESMRDDERVSKKRASESPPPEETAASSPKKFKYLNLNAGRRCSRSKSKSPSPAPGNEDANSVATARIHHGPDQKHDIDYIKKSFDGNTQYSQRAEYQKLLATPDRFIREKFLVEMPDDFYRFWDFCKSQCKNEQKPEEIFEKFGLQLVGPFDVLAGKFDNADLFEPGDYLRHWRYFYDPPEFQTLFRKDKTGIHYGYWRDNPDKNCLVARNDAAKNCEFDFVADNVFGAVIHYLDKEVQLSPFTRPAADTLKKSLEDYARNENITLNTFSSKLKARNLNAVCKTFHRGGLVVPFDRSTDVGYRQLLESDANLKKILAKLAVAEGDSNAIDVVMDQLQPIITAANIAVDESDFGTSIELGIDLFCFGAPELHSTVIQLLANGYAMVNKPQFIAILKAHLEKRTKGNSPSILN